jgi:hypothetical protein
MTNKSSRIAAILLLIGTILSTYVVTYTLIVLNVPLLWVIIAVFIQLFPIVVLTGYIVRLFVSDENEEEEEKKK